MATVEVEQTFVIGLLALAALSTMIMLMILVTLNGKIPEWKTLFKAAMYKRPLIMVHMVNGECLWYSPKRSGKEQEQNYWKLPAFLGIKFTPTPGKEERYYNRHIYHYFQKTPLAITPKDMKALDDFMKLLIDGGVDINTSDIAALDALLVAQLDPSQMMDGQITQETYDNLVSLKERMRTCVINNGLFVWNAVDTFARLASYQTSQELDETVSIANANAIENSAHKNGAKDYMQMIIYGIMVLVFLAIAQSFFFQS
jgi:hypothetical protein